MDEILAGINSTITDIELVSDDTRKAINDTFTSGVQEIEFYKFSMEVKLFFPSRTDNPVLLFSLFSLVYRTHTPDFQTPNSLSAFIK